MVLVFDMDDTLYEEATYVRSGFMAVAKSLTSTLGASAEQLNSEMLKLLEQLGRGKVFDSLLERYGKLSRRLVRECVSCYRLHKPDISLHQAGLNCLHRFRHVPLYVVTDGNKTAQASKMRALNLDSKTKKVFITHCYGIHHAKPSPHCFKIIQNKENIRPDKIVYIGDNPSKDFHGIKPLGFRTIRVLTGPHAEVVVPPWQDAELTVASLDGITSDLINRMLI